MWSIIAFLAEERIQEALRAGEFDNLPGAGKPLVFEDDSHIPPELRMAYKLLRNADCLPPELQEEQEIHNAIELLSGVQDEQERYRQIQKLNYLIMNLNLKRRRPISLEQNQLYYQRTVEKLSVNPRDDTPPQPSPQPSPEAPAGERPTVEPSE